MTDARQVEPTKVVGGRYELGPLIGQGGMAVVYDARDRRLGRPVALKLLRQELAHQEVIRRRFESEAQLAARLAHPNVVSVLDCGDEGRLAFIVMERLSGRTLYDEIGRGPLALDAVHHLAVQMLAALGAAHEAGIVHRDIKPGNILAGNPGEWKLGDFGIAKAAELPTDQTTATGLLIGTPAYLAPERFFGGEATVQSDLYALGVVLYEALAARKPFDGATPQECAWAAATVTPGPIQTLRPDVDPSLAEVIDRCLAQQPERRFRSAAETAEVISGPTSWGHVPPVGAVARPGPPSPTAVLPTVERPGQSRPFRPIAGPTGRPLSRKFAVGAAVLIVAVVLLVSAIGHSGRTNPGSSTSTSPSPSTSTKPAATPASGSLPTGLDQALRHLQSEVQH